MTRFDYASYVRENHEFMPLLAPVTMELVLLRKGTMAATPDRIKEFYHSPAWKGVRDLKRRLERGICQRCGNAGWEVHHKVPLTLSNVDDPNVSLGLENLELLCTSCHDAERRKGPVLRQDIVILPNGDVVKKT